MKQTINFSRFADSFQCRPDNFSYDGLRAMFEYFEELEDSCGIELEFDPIGICCEYCEYDSVEELKEDYTDIEDLDDLRDQTTVIEIPDSERIIVACF